MKNLNTVFPFYDLLSERNSNKEYVDRDYLLTVDKSTVVPFIVRRTHSAGTVSSLVWKTYDSRTGVQLLDIGGDPWIAGAVELEIATGTYYDYIVFDGHAITVDLPAGVYYFVIEDTYVSAKSWYSETFDATDTSAVTDKGNNQFVKLVFSNIKQISNISESFEQVLYYPGNLKTPEYLREDTGDKRDGLMVFEKQVLAKIDILHLSGIPEFLVDALMLLPLMDHVALSIGATNYTWDEVQVKDPEWQDVTKGALAKLEVRFIGGVVIKKLNFKEVSVGITLKPLTADNSSITADNSVLTSDQILY